MNDNWKRQAAVVQRGDKKLTDIVYGQLTDHQKDMMHWHLDHPTPYYCNTTKEDPYGTHQSKTGI